MTTPEKLLSVKEVASLFGVTENSIWRWVQGKPGNNSYKPDFPKPLKCSARVTRWKAGEIAAYQSGLEAVV